MSVTTKVNQRYLKLHFQDLAVSMWNILTLNFQEMFTNHYHLVLRTTCNFCFQSSLYVARITSDVELENLDNWPRSDVIVQS